MLNAVVNIDKSLYFFLKKKYGQNKINIEFKNKRTVKDLLESIGIPHVEVGDILIDGERKDINFLIDRDCSLRVFNVLPGMPAPVAFPPVFILDVHLGKLALNLRMLGFKADYSNNRDDRELAGTAEKTGGILLSCDRGLLMRRNVKTGMVIRSREPVKQAAEVVRRFNLYGHIKPFSVCPGCGGALKRAGKLDELTSSEKNSLPPKVRGWCDEYTRCAGCGQLYWEGSHFPSLLARINEIIAYSKAP